MSNFRKLISLSLFEWLVLICAVFLLPIVSLLLKLKGFRKTEKMLARFSRVGREDEEVLDRVTLAARMVSVAAVHGPFKAQCLPQAICLWWMLGILGIVSTIRLGIYKTGEQVQAHAWVLFRDEIVLGDTAELDSFTPLLDVNINRY